MIEMGKSPVLQKEEEMNSEKNISMKVTSISGQI